jgi:hypothetical protein
MADYDGVEFHQGKHSSELAADASMVCHATRFIPTQPEAYPGKGQFQLPAIPEQSIPLSRTMAMEDIGHSIDEIEGAAVAILRKTFHVRMNPASALGNPTMSRGLTHC